jgi:hypothetical protein
VSWRNQKQNAIHLSVEQMHQTKLQQVQVDAWLSNTISGHGPDSHESNCASQLAARAKCLRSQALCIAFGTLACPSIASTNIIKADLDVGNLLFQIFKADLNFIRYLSSILWQINKMCNNGIDGSTVLLSTAPKICLNGKCHDGDVTRAAPTIFCDTPRRLIVEYNLLIQNSAGAWTHQAQLPLPTKPNVDFRLVVEFIPILIFDGARAPLSMLIVGCNYSKISLHFCKDFRIFCEEEWEVKDNGDAVVKQQSANSNYSVAGFQLVVKSILIPSYEGAQRATSRLIVICAFGLNKLIELIFASGHQPNSKISFIFGEGCRTFREREWEQQLGNISLVGYTGLAGLIKLVELISFVGHDGIFGLIGPNGLAGQISLIGLIGINGRIGLNGHNDVVGLASIVGNDGLINPNDLVGFIGLGVSFIGFSGHNGDISLIGLGFILSACWLIGFIGLGLVGFIGFGLDSLVSISGLIGHNCLDGIIGLGLVSLVDLVGLSGINGLIGKISLISLIGISGFGLLGGFGLSALFASVAS